MYKVIIADDHIPVLDYIIASVPWKDLNLELSASCSDGGEALEASMHHRPDILITDIGMPVMDGLTLIDEVREINPRLKTIILSCHEDFQFAQRAVKLNVSEYILKESLRIDQLTAALRHLVSQLSEETARQKIHRQLQDVVEQNRSALGTKFLRTLMEQPVWNKAEWTEKAKTFGIRFQEGIPYLAVMAIPERSSELEERFGGTHNLQFVVDNALHDMHQFDGSVILALDQRHYFLLFPIHRTLKRNVHDDIRNELQQLQQSMCRHMRVNVSFFLGDVCDNLYELKKQIQELLDVKTFRFYAGESRITKIQNLEPTTDDIFVHYAEALQNLRDSILSGSNEETAATVAKWGHHIETKRYPVEAVRSWVLNIVTELELKYTVMQSFVSNFNAELLHRIIYSIDTFDHLKEWIGQFLDQKMTEVQALRDQSVRKEIAEAKRFVMMHLGEKIGMEEMANRLKLSPPHFSRIFKNETGETFVEFVTRSKMERAQELLNRSDLTIQQIAEQLGFENTSYFIKVFRSSTGKSPNEYRNTI